MKKQNGITLIALIITIIILLILAMVSIKLVMNSGIITKAQKGVDVYSEEEIKEKIQLAYTDYKMAKASDDVSYTMQEAINNAGLEGAKAEETEEGWTITVPTKDGDKVYSVSDLGVSKTQKALKLGDYVNYDPAPVDSNAATTYTSYALSNVSANKNNGRTSGYSIDQTFNVGTKTDGWRVLSIENGQIKLISASAIQTKEGKDFYFSTPASDKAYLSAVDELNAICSIYGKGKGAESAKSLDVDDINKLTGYDPTTYAGYGNLWQYRYYNDGGMTSSLQYRKSTDNEASWTAWTNMSNGFNGQFYVPGSEIINNSNRKETEKYTYTNYSYNIENDKVLNLVKGEKQLANGQWIASYAIEPDELRCNFNVRYLSSTGVRSQNCLGGSPFYRSDGSVYTSGYARGVRPIVTLNANVEIDTSDSAKDGSSAAKAYELKAQ